MTLEAGARLGPYEVLSPLGRGGMGEVYKARDTRLGRYVAIKTLPDELTGEAELKRRLEREARIISRLQHPHICTLYDVGEEQVVAGAGAAPADRSGSAPRVIGFLVMEYLEGETLEQRLRRGPLAVADTLRVGREIAEALDAAHRAGVVHRDLKPGNVMLTKTGAKVLDFGIAKALLSAPDAGARTAAAAPTRAPTLTFEQTADGMLIGTLPYMAPEQVEGRDADARSDIWALGCVLHEMTVGERPFRGATAASLIAAILSSQPEPPTRKQSLAPPRLDWVVKRCLEKDPERRWQSARDVGIDLEALSAQPEDAAPRVAKASAVTGTAASRPRRIVVLPFESLGPAEHAYFAAGMTEEITGRLARLQGLGVISRTSAAQYARREKPIRQIGDELDVDYVLDGSIRWAPGERMRITPQLIRVADDTHLWAEVFDRAIDGTHDIFAIQSEIAERLSEQLDLSLLASTATVVRPPTTSMDAYHAYCRGLEADNALGLVEESMRLAARMFERAVALDPGFALAWAALAETRMRLYQFYDRRHEIRVAADEAVDRALAIDPGLPEGHRARAASLAGRDPMLAYRELEIAAAGLPNDSAILLDMGNIRCRLGEFTEGVALLERASTLDPRASGVMHWLAFWASMLRQYEKADRLYDRTVALAPDHFAAHAGKGFSIALWKGWKRAAEVEMPETKDPRVTYWRYRVALQLGLHREALALVDLLPADGSSIEGEVSRDYLRGWVYQAMGEEELAAAMYRSARVTLEAQLREQPRNERIESNLGLVYAGLGLAVDAIRHGRRAVEMRPVSKYGYEGSQALECLARIYALVGETESALDLLDQALSVPGFISVVTMEAEASFATLRGHPRYQALLEKHG